MSNPNLNILSKLTLLTLIWVVSSSFTSSGVATDSFIGQVNSVSLDDADISDYQKMMYEKDATRLALRYIAQGGGYDELGAEVPDEVKDELYSALIAVHKSPFSESVLVTQKHRLHTFPNPAVDKFQVNYKNTAKWATPLRLGDNITNSDIINKLSSKYGLKIESHQTWDDDSNLFIVKAKKAINLAPVANDFMEEEGVEVVKLLIPDSDGNDIEATRTSKGWKLDYIVKFEKCFTGCKKSHTWSFEVANISSGSANVNFIEHYGDELPPWMRD